MRKVIYRKPPAASRCAQIGAVVTSDGTTAPEVAFAADEEGRCGPLRVVDVAAVADRQDGHRSGVIIDAVKDAIGAPSCAIPVCHGWTELLPNTVWVLEQGANDELEGGGGDGFWEIIGEVSAS